MCVVLLTGTSEHHALSVASAVLLVLSAVASIGFGVIRGRTIELFVRGGELWERASWTTIGVGWGGLLLTRVALIGGAAAVGAKLAASPTSIPLMLAITLGAQMIVVRQRATAIGVAIPREHGEAHVEEGASARARPFPRALTRCLRPLCSSRYCSAELPETALRERLCEATRPDVWCSFIGVRVNERV